MPQESSITFSPGQRRVSSSPSVATLPVASDSPVYDFRAVPALGAKQDSRPVASSGSLSFVSLSSPGSIESADAQAPSSAMLPPRLNVAVPGRAPRLKTRQLWEGTVTEIRDGGFVAILSDKSNPNNPDEQAVFEAGEISPEDQGLVRPGASFYWVIGNESTVAGQVKNVSIVQFRRVPAWTPRKLAQAADHARRVRELLRKEE